MTFTHFPDERLLELWRGIIDANLIPHFGSSSPRPAAAETRALDELKRLNAIKRSEDGQVPLLHWLREAATLADGLPAGLLFRQALSDLAARVSGQTSIPDPAKFPEYYANLARPQDPLTRDFLAAGAEACGGVARLSVPRFDGGRHATFNGYPLLHDGTAWLVTPSLLVTSYHAVNARGSEEGHAAQSDFRQQAAHAAVEFTETADGAEAARLGVASLEIYNRQLDVVILRLARPAGGRPLRLAADRVSSDKDAGSPVNVVTCPAGQPHQVSVRGNTLSAATGQDVRFLSLCMINPPGAPVFNDSWQVIALHRGTTLAEGINYQGRTSAWLNVGTRVAAIIQCVKDEQPSLYEEIRAEGRTA